MRAALNELTIEAVIERRLVEPVFQPIVDLATLRPVGLEALARGPAGSALEFPDRLFAAAHASGVVGELDMLCAERALELVVVAAVKPPLLFVNAEPSVLNQPLSPRLIELVSHGLPFRQVLEFTERALPAWPGSLLRIAAQVQGWGNAVALDDVGVDPMSLAFLPILEPEVVKLDMSLVRDPAAASTRSVCDLVGEQSRRSGAVVIAEGIETEQDVEVARRLGAHWGQGWWFGRPGPLGQTPGAFDPAAAARLRPPRPTFHLTSATPFQTATNSGWARPVTSIDEGFALLRQVGDRDPAAIVLASCPTDSLPDFAGTLDDIVGRRGSVIVVDEPILGEFAAVVLGAGSGAAVCLRAPDDCVVAEHLPTVAEVARALMRRLT